MGFFNNSTTQFDKHLLRKNRMLLAAGLAGICISCVACGTNGTSDFSSTLNSYDAEVTNEYVQEADNVEDETEWNIEINPMWYFEFSEENAYPFEMTQKSRSFVEEHSDMFPAERLDDLSDYLNYEISYKHLSKNVDKYGDEIIYFDGYIIDISEDTSLLDLGENTILTSVQVMDADGNNYIILYYGELDFFDGDEISVYALPLGITNFDNIGGGTTIAAVVGGCYITPYNYDMYIE